MREEETPTMPLIVARVTVAAATVDELVARCARWFRDGEVVFVPTEAVQPSGRRVRFVFALASGEDVITGEGVVLRMRRDSGDPRRPPGMELRYEVVDESAAIVARILAAKKTPPPYVSMRIDREPIVRAAIEPTMLATPLPPPRASSARLATRPPLPSPDVASRAWRLVGVGLATAAAMLALAIAMAMMRRPPPDDALDGAARRVAVGGNGVVADRAPATAAPSPVAVDAPKSPVSAAKSPVSAAKSPVSAAKSPASAQTSPASAALPIALHIRTTPSGATVFVDGQERGPSPLTVTVAAGAHDVVAERPRWLAAHAHVDGPGRVELVLERPAALLRITSTPSGAVVRLDGRAVGVTPIAMAAAAFELHHVRIELDGRVWKRRVYLRPEGALVRVGARAPSVDEPGAVRVAHDLGQRVRP